MVDLFFCASAAGHAKVFFDMYGIAGEKVAVMEMKLHAGDISDPFNVSRRRDVYNVDYTFDSIVSRETRNLKKLLKKDISLCIWFSARDEDEYLGMLATLYQFDNKGIIFYLCDCTEICSATVYLQVAEKSEIPEKHLLSNEEKTRYLAEWDRLQKENAPLRSIKDGRITSMPADYIDHRIFEIMGDGVVKIADIAADILCNEMPRKLAYIEMRIKQLINEGKITEVEEVCDLAVDCYGSPYKNFLQYKIKAADRS